MKINVVEKIKVARELLSISEYPGFLYDYLRKNPEILENLDICLFKEDIDKLSGFIGYYEGAAIICINYKRPLGHQNMTLAHELGHYFMHSGVSSSDDHRSIDIMGKDGNESEAFEFGSELIYPATLFEQDFNNYEVQKHIEDDNFMKLAEVIDELCHKYCVSFAMVLHKCLFKAYQGHRYKEFSKGIKKEVGGSFAKYFDPDFYMANEEKAEYQQDLSHYHELKDKMDQAVSVKKVGLAVGESILDKYELLED